MADNVFAGEGVEIQAFYVAQFFACIFQAGFDLLARQVDLADVAGNDCFWHRSRYGSGTFFHLFGAGVLRFVQNDICAI